MKWLGIEFLAIGTVFTLGLLQVSAQTVTVGSGENELGTVQSSAPDSIVQITAEMKGLQAVAFSDLPVFGTYWEVLPGGTMAPLPTPVFDPSLPIFAISSGIFLVDASGGELAINRHKTAMMSASSAATAAVQAEASVVASLIDQVQAAATTSTAQTMSLAGSLSVSLDATTNGTADTPEALTNSISTPDYGTNLWLAQTVVGAGQLTGIGSNTIADVFYTIQTCTDLAQGNWINAGTIVGSELTNWTALSVTGGSTTNLFIRLRSEQSSDGSGIPDWWEAKYGLTNVDPNAQDSAGDGYTIYQKYQMGVNPSIWVTPTAPQGVVANYNRANSTATISWLPSPGPVTGYTVEDVYWNSTNVNSSITAITEASTELQPYNLASFGENIYQGYKVQAHYARGDSGWSAVVYLGLYAAAQDLILISASQGAAYLSIAPSTLPSGTIEIRLTRVDQYDANYYDDSEVLTNFDIPLSAFTNGLFSIPTAWLAYPVDDYQRASYNLWGETLGTNETPNSQDVLLTSGFNLEDDNDDTSTNAWMVPPYFDGRAQMKQNLIFQLRAAVVDSPFVLEEDYSGNTILTACPSDYAYAGFFQYDSNNNRIFNALLPFVDNYKFRNFVFNLSELNSDGSLSGLTYDSTEYMGLNEPPHYQFQPPAANLTTISPLLDANTTRWINNGLGLYVSGGGTSYIEENYYEIAMLLDLNKDYSGIIDSKKTMAGSVSNLFGLPFLSVKAAWGNSSDQTATLYPGDFTSQNSSFYSEVAQPEFQTIEYDFWNTTNNILPGDANFQPTNGGTLFLCGVGNSITLAAYAKLAVSNGTQGVFGYLGQYFDQAYAVDANGNVTSTNTGFLSPYGNFFATQPGQAALVTMPDVDTGERGTCTVYCVSLQVDKNHDGAMDLSFNGADATSQNSPYVFWANNNFDRFTLDADDQVEYDDDVKVAGDFFTPNTPVPDYNFKDAAGNRVIPCARDLQDFSRLWVCGIDTNLIVKLPSGSTITLNWGDVGSPNSGNPTIDVFTAADSDGGVGYLTNELTSVVQTLEPYIGRLGPGKSIQLNASQFANNWAGNHFIWCGVSNGTGGLTLTIADGNGNTLVRTTTYIQIVDIKQMYERWTVGEQPSIAPLTNAALATEDLPVAFGYSHTSDTNTPYILFVHGWNMERWEKDRFAEAAFKRLYWQEYKGRFGSFRWPTENEFKGISSLATNPNEKDNFDRSEYTAWRSGAALLNKLNDLNRQYPGHVDLLAHSMGNIVANEALRLAGSNRVVNTYVASQAAVSAHTYDTTIANYSFSYLPWSSSAVTPNIYGNWFLGNNGGGAGQVISFYNTNDYALQRSVWQLNQLFKPDVLVSENGTTWSYAYIGSPTDTPPWTNFMKATSYGFTAVHFDIANVLTNRYEVMALAAQSWTTALGATPGVHNVADTIYLGRSGSTRIWPVDTTGNNYAAHFWHSAEFRGDYWQQQGYWNELLGSDAFNLK